MAPGVPWCWGGAKPGAVLNFGASWKSWMPSSPPAGCHRCCGGGVMVVGLGFFAGDFRVPLWVKKGGMKFPADPDTPVIMIGPGTGVAPFRAAIQERVAQGRRGEEWPWEGLWMSLAADRSVFSIREGGTGVSGGFGQAQALLCLNGSKLGSGAGKDQSLVYAACVVIHRMCCKAAPWVRAGLCRGSFLALCKWRWVVGLVFGCTRSRASALGPSSFPWLSCGSWQEAEAGGGELAALGGCS